MSSKRRRIIENDDLTERAALLGEISRLQGSISKVRYMARSFTARIHLLL